MIFDELEIPDHGVQPSDIIVVWFSCGAASAVAAKKTIERFPECRIRVVNNPVIEEHQDNLRFLKDVEQWLGVPIEFAINKDYPSCSAIEIWERRRYMSGTAGAPCTVQLKEIARQQWERQNHVNWHVLGFTWEEKKRHDNFILSERSNLLPVLIDEHLTKQDCIDLLQKARIKPPALYSLGYPNANCIGCVKASSPTYWNLVRDTFPKVFEVRAKQSREIGCRLVEVYGKRIYLDELSPEEKGALLNQ